MEYMTWTEPTTEEVAEYTKEQLFESYETVMGEMTARSSEKHRAQQSPPHPLMDKDNESILRFYRLIHGEMMKRHNESSGDWNPVED